MVRFVYLLLLLIPFVSHGQSIQPAADADWRKSKTFRVGAGEIVFVLKEEVDEELFRSEVRKVIRQELESRGFTFVEDGEADLFVAFTGEVAETTNVEKIGPLGQRPADEPIELNQGTSWSQDLKRGSIAIEISRFGSKEKVWGGGSEIEFSGEDPIVAIRSATGRALRKAPSRKK
jgi:hypothetical protein